MSPFIQHSSVLYYSISISIIRVLAAQNLLQEPLHTGLDKNIEAVVQRYFKCQQASKLSPYQESNPWPIIEASWSHTHLDTGLDLSMVLPKDSTFLSSSSCAKKAPVISTTVYMYDHRQNVIWAEDVIGAGRCSELYGVNVGGQNWVRHRNHLRPRYEAKSLKGSFEYHFECLRPPTSWSEWNSGNPTKYLTKPSFGTFRVN